MIIMPFRRIVPSAGPSVTPGSVSFTTPGTYNFEVPNFHTLTADCRGAGGGGGGWNQNGNGVYFYGAAGGLSRFNAPTGNLIANGGGGGQGMYNTYPNGMIGVADGAPGTASSGDTNTTGGGSAGGVGADYHNSNTNIPQSDFFSGHGGPGGRAVKTWTKGLLVPKTIIQIVVGPGGAAGHSDQPGYVTPAAAGLNGGVYLSWS